MSGKQTPIQKVHAARIFVDDDCIIHITHLDENLEPISDFEFDLNMSDSIACRLKHCQEHAALGPSRSSALH